MVSACVLIRTEKGKYDNVVESVQNLKEVKNIFSVLGRFDVVVDLESDNYQQLCNTTMRIGRISGVIFTETSVEVIGE